MKIRTRGWLIAAFLGLIVGVMYAPIQSVTPIVAQDIPAWCDNELCVKLCVFECQSGCIDMDYFECAGPPFGTPGPECTGIFCGYDWDSQ